MGEAAARKARRARGRRVVRCIFRYEGWGFFVGGVEGCVVGRMLVDR